MQGSAYMHIFNLLDFADEIAGRITPEASNKEQTRAREAIAQGLTMLAPAFAKNKHILGEDFSMIDVALAPLLWRLDHYDIKLGKSAAPLLKYAERLFQRDSFIEALTPAEKAMRR